MEKKAPDIDEMHLPRELLHWGIPVHDIRHMHI